MASSKWDPKEACLAAWEAVRAANLDAGYEQPVTLSTCVRPLARLVATAIVRATANFPLARFSSVALSSGTNPSSVIAQEVISMEQHVISLGAQIEAIGRYLGHTFPAAGIDRYDDPVRNVVGFRFIGAVHGNVEFARELLETLPSEESGVALELHLRHAGSEINATPPSQRLVFTIEGTKREPTG